MTLHPDYYIGIMSGTSTDAVDAVLAAFEPEAQMPRLAADCSIDIPDVLRQELLALNHAGGINELHRSASAAHALTELYARAVHGVLERSGRRPGEIKAVGVHGQTVRHCPELGYTVQLNCPALLAERCGIDVVADFRSRDIAAGGQGAPLVPAFHQAIFAGQTDVALLNIGGICNLTLLDSAGAVGYDVGPGNMLMDAWCHAHTGCRYDEDGRWGAGGRPDQALLQHLLASEPWFALPPPKSTGRDRFNLDWLTQRLQQLAQSTTAVVSAQDVQATLRCLTARLIAEALRQKPPAELVVFGGGVNNLALMRDIDALLPHTRVLRSDDIGIPAQAMEALTFAWLARQFMEKCPIGGPQLTGARHPTIAGCLYPA